jgi:lysophospholipase
VNHRDVVVWRDPRAGRVEEHAMKKVLVLLAIIPPMTLNAIDEQDFQREWSQQVAPYVAQRSVEGELIGTGGVVLRYLAIEKTDPGAALVMLGGHAESFRKYEELFYDLRDLDLSIYALDPRGQGSSDRLLADREKSHVDHWQDYVADLKLFVDDVVRARTNAPIIALGHSLGGGIVAAYLEQHPSDMDSAILSAPLVGHKAGGLALALLGVMNLFGGTGYVPGGGPFTVVQFEANKETHSRVRHLRKFQDNADHPETRMGFPTVHWMVETGRMAESIQAGAGRITVPLLVFQAGQDEYVDARSLESFAGKAAAGRRVLLEGARHEMLIETDAIRGRVLSEIRGFILGRIGGK